jgi:hypothetical protein
METKVKMQSKALLIFATFLMFSLSAFAQQRPCCSVVSVNAATGMVTARENASGKTFVFRLTNAALLPRITPGAPVYANFAGKQVSLDGKTACCQIVGISAAAGPVQPSAPPTPATSPATGTAQKPAGALAAGRVPLEPARETLLPQVSYGTPQDLTKKDRTDLSIHRAAIVGSNVNRDVVHLAGIEGIEKANIPEGAKNLLIMHAMTLPPEELDHYIVNTKLAEEWMKTHPAPASTKKHAGSTHSGCHAISMHCASEAAKHAQGEAERQSEKLRQQASDEWRHVSLEAAHDWKMAEDCMADKTLHLTDLPVNFSILPNIPLSFEKDVHVKNAHGDASGTTAP